MIWYFLMLALIFMVTFVLINLARSLIRKICKIEKVSEDDPSQNYVEQRHREVDKPFKDYGLVILFIILVVDLIYFAESNNIFISAVLTFAFIRMIIKAFFEWKYAKYQRQFILTLTDIVILLAVVIVVVKFNLLY